MFGFFSKFKTDVVNGFDAVHQRLVTLEARVEALFHHAATVKDSAPAEVAAAVESEVKTVEAAVEAPKDAA